MDASQQNKKKKKNKNKNKNKGAHQVTHPHV